MSLFAPPVRSLVGALLGLTAAPLSPLLATPGEGGKGASSPWALSAALQQAYDDNVFLVSGSGMAPVRSWVSSASARIAWERTGLPGAVLEALTIGYSPELVRYASARSENYGAHRLNAAGRFRQGAVSACGDVSGTWIDGEKLAPYYAAATHDDQRSAYATAAARERRDQFQLRAKATVTLDRPGWFWRGVASALSLDLGTDWRAEPGYQNYVDRRDLNAGCDLGWKLPAGTNVTAGYRRGYQFQQMLPAAIDRTQANASGGYDRLLLGLEGKPVAGMTLSLQTGPETHRYPGDSPERTVLVSGRTQTRWFTEGSVALATRSAGSATLKYKRWMWLSSTGKVPLIETTVEAGYHREFRTGYALDLGLKAAASDYRCGGGSAALRNDWMYSTSIKLTARVTPGMTLTCGATQDLGRNGRDDLATVAPTQLSDRREFDRRGLFFSITLKP